MRRSLGTLMSTIGVSALALSVGTAVPRHAGDGELLYLGTRNGIAVVDSTTGDTMLSARDALPSGDWSQILRARAAGNGSTVVEAVDPVTGEILRTQRFDEELSVRAVSLHGDLVALMPREPGRYGGNGLYRPASRDKTRIVLTHLDGSAPRSIDLDANVEPEAFSNDNAALFVIRYAPALHPDRYRVSRLDLSTGELGYVFTNEKELQGDMRGIAYTQVVAPDGTKVYTFYKKPDGEAFVHVLNLDQQFANCVDLPEGFGTDPAAVAITTTPQGGQVIVVDGAARTMVDVDATELKVLRTKPFRGVPTTGERIVAVATPSGVYVSSERSVVELSRVTGRRMQAWSTDGRVQALHLGTTGLVLVAEGDRVTAYNSRGGGRSWSVKVPEGGIRSVADTLPYTAKGSVDCAC
ncbi:MAG: hypothetical protein WEA75_00815 [Acidimicrobiia bacterium]